MEIKKKIEQGRLVTIKIYNGGEKTCNTELETKEWFEQEEKNGFTFHGCEKDNEGKTITYFILTDDLKNIIYQH